MGYGPGCGKKIDITIPTKYSAKILQMPCGSTGIYGYPNLCEECEKKNEGRDWRREAREAGEYWDEDEY
jgi:O-acetyl-ADP-ribose deacetylase (regulator of RNase III)